MAACNHYERTLELFQLPLAIILLKFGTNDHQTNSVTLQKTKKNH